MWQIWALLPEVTLEVCSILARIQLLELVWHHLTDLLQQLLRPIPCCGNRASLGVYRV